MDRRETITICVILFALSFAVRILVWQNNKLEMAKVQSVVTQNYLNDARTLAARDIRRFLAGQDPPSDANVISHPPGYPMMAAAVFAVTDNVEVVRVLQIAANSFASILLFLIALQLFDRRTSVVAGSLAALAPQFAYHSGLLLPDELSVLPLLAAVYFFVRFSKEPKWAYAAFCGVSIGLSCWLRSNALFLPAFFALVAFALSKNRLQFAGVLLAAFLLTIAPITIRNAVIFEEIIPLSLGGGTTLVEGLGDIDDGGKSLPKTDEDVMRLDEKLLGTPPGTYTALYTPDGVVRDRTRLRFGMHTIAESPGWYLKGIVLRGLSTLRLERVPAIDPARDERETTNAALYWINRPLKLLQRLFISALILPLVLLGIVVAAGRGDTSRRLWILAVLPVYYMTVQALIHTEYRYVLATPHIMMIFAAVGIVFVVEKIGGLFGRRNVSDLAAAE